MRALLAAGCALLALGVAVTDTHADGAGRTPACKTLTIAEALDAMDARGRDVTYGRGWVRSVRQISGTRRFNGKEVTCSWVTKDGLGNIYLLINVLPTPAEATRYFKSDGGPCPKVDRLAIGAGGCGWDGFLAAHWGRFALTVNGATGRDGSIMGVAPLAIVARQVFARAPRVLPAS